MREFTDKGGREWISATGAELRAYGPVILPLEALGLVLSMEDNEAEWQWFRMLAETVISLKMRGEKADPLAAVAAMVENDFTRDGLMAMIYALKLNDLLDDEDDEKLDFLNVVVSAPMEVIRSAVEKSLADMKRMVMAN